MDCEQDNNAAVPRVPGDEESRSAVNSLILDYYKKFGRKRDLEQYFSLSTAQTDIRDPSSIFWARMKADNESSDSGDRSDNKKSDSSQELCRISIRFPAQDPSISQEEDSNSKTKTESASPPIIIEELPEDSIQHSDDGTKSEDEALKSDDNNSQKSFDVQLDTSLNKLHSPSSSITSQRRLEWDSLADVGYANESDRKTSASSLSTLERLALKQQQQYSNDSQQNSNLGIPTAHSTPLDENEAKSKLKKGMNKKSTKIYKKDVDIVEVNVPHSSSMNPAQSINVNLTKHISFNVEKDGKVTVDNILKDVSISPEKKSIEASPPRIDREMQSSLTRASRDANSADVSHQKIPIMISLNTLKSRIRRRRLRMARRKHRSRRRADKENIPVQEKSGEQLSDAESFEYMPGHIYNQNQMTVNRPEERAPHNAADNKSSLESSGILTSESSKGSKHSFTKDLEKSIDLLKTALNQRCDDSILRKKLIQQVCQRLLSSKYRDDDSTTDFLSGLSFSSKKLGLSERNNTTTSTSDTNNSAEKCKKPKKSILRSDKFNAGCIASTSQSVPNLPVASKSENPVTSNLTKNFTTSNTDSDMSSKEKTSSENGFAKTSSEELYQKYLQAVKREEAYKKHLKDKETFLKQKLVSSDGALKVPESLDVKQNDRLKNLINDLTRNNYDDGSGDASKLEGGPSYHRDFDRFLPNRAQRSHSVFTLSSGASDGQNKKSNLKKNQCDAKDLPKPGPSKESHYCCCPHHGNLKFVDSAIQVNIKSISDSHSKCKKEHQILESPKRSPKMISEESTGNFKCVCRKEHQTLESPKRSPKMISEGSTGNLKCVCRKEHLTLESPKRSPKIISEESTGNLKCVCRKELLTLESPKRPAKIISEESTGNLKYVCLCSKNIIQEAPDDFLVYKCSRLSNKGVQLEDASSKSSDEVYVQCSNETCPKRNIGPCPSVVACPNNKSSQTNMLIKMLYEQPMNTNSPGFDQKHIQRSGQVEDGTSSRTTVTVSEATRWIQTEISIDPKISEPTLSDINIVSDTNCAKLVSEHYREIPKPSLTDVSNKQAVTSASAFSDSYKSTTTSDNIGKKIKASSLPETKSEISRKDNIDQEGSVNRSENYAIPIHGTNMTLMVSIGSEHAVNQNKNTKEMVTESVGTEKVSAIEQATSLREECSKGVQAEQMSQDYHTVDHNSNKIDNINLKKSKISRYNLRPLNVNPYLAADASKSGTYPKTSPLSERKKFRRANTESDKFQKILSPREVESFNKQTIHKVRIDASTEYDRNEPRGSPSGRKGIKENSKVDFGERVITQNKKIFLNKGNSPLEDNETLSPKILSREKETSQCGKHVSVKEIDTQSDITIDQNENCPCGCGGTKYMCKRSCNYVKIGVRNESPERSRKQHKIQPTVKTQTYSHSNQTGHCGTMPLDREMDTQTDTSPTRRELCPCGCRGYKDKCKKSCKECSSSPRNDVLVTKNVGAKQPNTDKQIRTPRVMSPKQINTCNMTLNKKLGTQTDNNFEKCPCGCGGTKDKCKNTCEECKTTPRNDTENIKCGTRPYKQMDTQTDNLPNRIEYCLCGCGGIKDNCQKSCKGLSSSRERERMQDQTTYTAAYTPDLNLDKEKRSAQGITTQTDKNEVETQRNIDKTSQNLTRYQEQPTPSTSRNIHSYNTDNADQYKPVKKVQSNGEKTDRSHKSSSETEPDSASDPILTLIQNITKKYTKNDVEKNRRKKCFREIVTVLNYLLDTDESPDEKEAKRNRRESTTTAETDETDTSAKMISHSDKVIRRVVDKGVQPTKKIKSQLCAAESVGHTSTDIPVTSSDSAAYKALNKIKKECEKYHQKRCKIHGRNGEATSSTSVNCEQCRRVHHCQCRIHHKCKGHKKSSEKAQKTPIAYNLILQTSESVVSEEPSTCEKTHTTLKNIIVKVPKKKPHPFMPFREIAAKFEKQMCGGLTKERCYRSKSLPNDSEISSMDEIIRKSQGATVREYLEKNRPDFIEKCGQRQTCMRYISETRCEDPRAPSNLKMVIVHTPNCTGNCNTYCGGVPNMTRMGTQSLEPRIVNVATGVTRIASERAVTRELLSLHVARLPPVMSLDAAELRRLAADLGRYMRDKQPAPKFINEREMKKHSEKIYKSLPEVVQKKEEKRKETIKKTNLLMADMFKRNLQKKTLRGSVNLSNYNTVIKI